MSKREKNIEITETQKMVKGKVVVELTLKNESLGTVWQDERKYIAKLPSGEEFRVATQEEGFDVLIRDYHLHRG